MDDRPARDPEENVGGLFPETAIVFRLCLSFSEFRHAFVSEGVPSAVGDDDVVQERNLKQVQSLLQGLRCLDVGFSRSGTSRRVVMVDDYGRSLLQYCRAEYLGVVNHSARH